MDAFYHIVNRGVDKRSIVEDDEDRVRFVHDLYMLNDREQVNPNHRFKSEVSSREPLVKIHTWCLRSNHYHMLVSEEIDGGISQFMRKLNMGYAKYFNNKYERSGYLWQGVYRKVLIDRDAHFIYIPFYIHLNPLDLKFPEWRLGKIRDVKRALEYLRSYRWSSYLDYQGEKNFPSIIDPELLGDSLGSSARQQKEITSLICDTEGIVGRLEARLE